MIEYRIQQTHAGVFIVRNQADNQLARFDTEAEAQTFIIEQQAATASRAAQTETAIADRESYMVATPTLTEAQLTWQQWRTWFYGAMRWAAKDTAAMQRAIDMKAGKFAGRPSFEKQEGYLTDAMREDLEARQLYDRAVELDTRIKAARRGRDTAALAEALAEAEPLIEEMRPFFATVGAPPPAPRKTSGTAPNASLVLTPEELRLIEERFGGSKSAAIHAGLATLASGD